MTTLPSMGLVLPTRGPSGAGLWGDTDDANLGKLDVHDHTPGHGVLIPTAGIGINADLPFSALWAPTQLHRVQFSPVAGASLTGGMVKSLFVSDGTSGLVANELYWRTNAGASVQLTAGSTLNVGTFSGTIGGDYGGVGAQLNYTDSSKTYDFKESTADSHGWARLQCGGIRLIEFNTTESFFVSQVAPAALAGSYTVTWPTALPGSTNPVFIDNAGQLSFPSSATFPGAITVSSGGAAITGNSTVTGNLNVTGTLTFGEVQTYSMAFAIGAVGTTTTPGGGAAGAPPTIALGTVGAGAVNCPLRFRIGTTITAWQVRLIKNTGAVTLSAKLYKAASGSAVTQIGATQSNSAASPGLITLTQSGLTEVVAANTNYFIEIVGSGSSGDIAVDYQATTA